MKPHRHVWSIRAAAPIDIHPPHEPNHVIETKTDVLYVCLKCHKMKVKTIKGVWTREQLR